jgi:peptide/nickel transport system substrate-binding protein
MADSADRYDRRAFLTRGATTAAAMGLAGVGLPALLSACGSSTTPAPRASTRPGIGVGTPKRGGTVQIGLNSEIDGFLPSASHFDNSGLTYANTIFDTLTVVAADGSAKPYLAQSVVPNGDMTEWTITLRRGVTFHDGSPLNADVLLANLQAIQTSALTGQAVRGVVDTVAKVAGSDLAVTVTCVEPIVAFPQYLATQVGYVIAMAQLESQSTTKPIGTGPFSLVEWVPNDHLTVKRNPNYWRSGLPYLDGLTYRPIAEDQSRENSLKSGTIDLMVTRDPNAIRDLQDDASYQLVRNPDVGQGDMDFVILNTDVDPTNDLVVRQALAYAIDVDELVKLFGAGIAKPNLSLFPPGSPYRAADNGYPTYDLAKAKQLVAQAAPNHGGTIEIALATITDPRLLNEVQAIASMWGKAGVKTTISEIEQVTFIDNLVEGKFQAYTDEMFGASDPDLNYVWLSPTTANPPIALNFARNKDDRLEADLQQGRTKADQSTRIQAYQAVDKRLSDDLPYLWASLATWCATGSNVVQNFNNQTLPDGSQALGFANGILDPTPIWRKA